MKNNNNIKVQLTINLNIDFIQYKNENIYFYNIISDSPHFFSRNGFTNKSGINKLKKGETDFKSFPYKLVNKDEIEAFRKLFYMDAVKNISDKNIMEQLNKEGFELIQLEGSSHSIKNLNGKFLAKLISFDLYEISNRDFDFDLDEIKKNLLRNKNLDFSCEEPKRKWDLVEKDNNVVIQKIPYYNSDNDDDKYIHLLWYPKQEQWDKLMKIFIDNNDIDIKSGFVSDIKRKIIELGILGFENKNKLYTKKYK